MGFKTASAALLLMSLSTGAAHAATTVSFSHGLASPGPGQSIVYDFDNTTPASLITNALVQIKSPPTDPAGAPPANSIPNGTKYLSVLAGGFASILFTAPVTSFSFDWGSVDRYNTLTILPFGGGDSIVVPGQSFTNTPASGNQTAPSTNGRFTVTGTSGTQYLGFNLTSTSNSFEIDNVAVAGVNGAVPEPATWAMMLLGFGMIGFGMRYGVRRSNAKFDLKVKRIAAGLEA